VVILHRDGPVRRTGGDPKPASVPDLARVLRQARAARGLELFQVSRQTGIPLELLQDLESGTVDRLPDRVAILQAVGRYAAFLGLPGDQFVMTLVEHWPNAPAAAAAVSAAHDTSQTLISGDTTVGTIAPPAPPVPTRPGSLPSRAVPLSIPSSGAPPTSVGLPIFEEPHNSTAQVPLVMADTGKTPAVRRGRSDGLLMAFVRALIVVCLILVVVGTAWLVINRVHPQWLADLRLPYTAQSVGPAAPTGTGHSKTDTSHSTGPATPTKPALKLVSANGSSATFSVTTALFSVRVTASGGDTWVQATDPLSTTPAYEGIVHAGQTQVVSANHQLVVQIGSTAARIAVEVRHHVIGTYVPPGAPFKMTFTSQ